MLISKTNSMALILACSGLLLTGCKDNDSGYTLYRESEVAGDKRLHVATFDSFYGADFNEKNCEATAIMFHEKAKLKFWCEKGPYKP